MLNPLLQSLLEPTKYWQNSTNANTNEMAEIPGVKLSQRKTKFKGTEIKESPLQKSYSGGQGNKS